MVEMKCPNCGKCLGVLEGIAQIKCPRCKQLATYKSKSACEPEEKPASTGEDEAQVLN